MRVTLVVLLLAACEPDGAPAAPDAMEPCGPPTVYEYTPVTVSGTTPLGDLGALRYQHLSYVDCGIAYTVYVLEEMRVPYCTAGNVLTLDFDAYDPDDRTLRAAGEVVPAKVRFDTSGSELDGPHAETQQAEFRIEVLDGFEARPTPRVKGRFVSTDPAWSFDIAVDSLVQSVTVCF